MTLLEQIRGGLAPQIGGAALAGAQLGETARHDVPRYYVVARDGSWHILYRNDSYGPYLSEREALLFAIDAAHGIGRRRGEAEVLIEGEPAHFRLVWRYGDNPNPPTG